jgi:predicted GIY-YIG superfamily endonuclease
MAECWLYVYENRAQRSIYIGIADSMSRVFGEHNSEAEKLRDARGTEIVQTLKPFSSRADARKAEAIAIYVATLAGVKVSAETGDGTVLTYTNIAGTASTGELGPAILVREGTLHAAALTGTVLVPITPNEVDGRPGPFGGRGGALFAERTSQYGNIARAKRPHITRAIAVLTGGRSIVLGDWDVDPSASWKPDIDVGSRVAIPLINAGEDDPRGTKGMRLIGHRLNSGPTYSADLR